MTGGPDERYPREVKRKAARFAAARRRPDPWWRHAAHVGVLGWLLVLPLVAGALAGRFLARHTGIGGLALAGLLVGLAAGLLAVWRRLRASLRQDDDEEPPP